MENAAVAAAAAADCLPAGTAVAPTVARAPLDPRGFSETDGVAEVGDAANAALARNRSCGSKALVESRVSHLNYLQVAITDVSSWTLFRQERLPAIAPFTWPLSPL